MLNELIALSASFLVFGMLARVAPCNRDQRCFLTRELADNTLFCVFGTLVCGGLTAFYLRTGFSLIFPRGAPASALSSGFGPMSRLPLLAQVGLAMILRDLAQYWLHRMLHGRTLWPVHAVHHSAEELDWSTTYRFHPGDLAIYVAGVFAMVRLLGFSPAAVVIIGIFNMVMGPLAHANVNWTFGPFRYVLASPVYHRWHHVKDPAIYNCNFAPNFPVIDLIFGTFYMPKGVLPQEYGVEEKVPTNFIGQLVYPFLVIARRLRLSRKTPAGQAAA